MPRTRVTSRSGRTAVARPRRWRVSVIRHRGEYLGTVEAPDESAAAEQFHLNDQQRKRVVLREVAS